MEKLVCVIGTVWLCHDCLSCYDAAKTFCLKVKAKGSKTKPKLKAKVEETVTVEEKEDVDQVENPPPRILPNKMTDVCKKYRQGNCPHGRSGHRMVNGSSCLKPHHRTCFKYMKYGADQQRGCTQGLECNWFHPVICQTSLQKLRCKKEVCSLIHLYTACKAKKDDAGRFPSEHKSSQRSNGPSVGNSTRDRVKKDTKLTLMKEKDFPQALLNQQEQFLREMEDLKELVTHTRYQSPLTHPNEWPAVQIPLAANQPQAHPLHQVRMPPPPGWRESLQKICPQSIY